jgi:Pyridoxamine 5'-phosphate oxidase
MPKAVSRKTSHRSTAPDGVQVGLPDVPPLYGMKTPHKFLPLSYAEDRLSKSRNYWICTVRPDGRPHSIPVWGFWLNGMLYFGTARSSRKARNLARNCSLSVHLESADDVVILEGQAVELNLADKDTVRRLDTESRAKYKMPLMMVPETIIYRVAPRVVLAWTEKEFPTNATKWTFDNH